jgi:ankyrin repeat protein
VLTRFADARAAVNDPLFAFGGRAIHQARTAELIDTLLEFGADVNLRSDWWAGPWHVLHGAEDKLAAHLMQRGAVADACAAAHLDRLDLLEHLLDEDPTRVHERGGDGQMPLHFARSRAVVDLLLERGADIDARDIDHRATPAQWMLENTFGAGRYGLAEYLVRRGAQADIFLAAALGLLDRLQQLVHADPAVLDLRTTQGEYAEKPPSSFHIYMWTIGANLSPIQVATQFHQHTAMAVLRELASPRQRFLAACVQGDASNAKTLLRKHPDLIETLQPDDQRALPDAAWTGNVAAVELMLELGFDPFSPGQDTGTVLHCAAWQGNAACTRVVLRHGAARELVHTREKTHGGTPLGWCCHGSIHCRHGDYPAVARMLLEAGAETAVNYAETPREVRRVIEDWRS